MNIAILSDSHGGLDRLDEALGNLSTGGVRYVLHAGDFAVYDVEEVFKKHPDLKFFIALGNCDINEEVLSKVAQLDNVELAEIIETKIDGIQFAIAHRKEDLSRKSAQIYISGHTHIPKIEKRGSQLWLNPGSLFEDNRYFLLDTKTLAMKQKLFNEKT